MHFSPTRPTHKTTPPHSAHRNHCTSCAPKGAALLWAARAAQPRLAPPSTSHGAGLGFRAEFLWQGTADPTAWLAAPACLEALERLGGLEALAARNVELAAEAAALLRARWRVEEPPFGAGGPGSNSGAAVAMAAVRLPAPLALPASSPADAASSRSAVPATPEGAARLQQHLREAHRIEVPVICCQGRLYCRISAQAYNAIGQYEALADAVAALVVAAE